MKVDSEYFKVSELTLIQTPNKEGTLEEYRKEAMLIAITHNINVTFGYGGKSYHIDINKIYGTFDENLDKPHVLAKTDDQPIDTTKKYGEGASLDQQANVATKITPPTNPSKTTYGKGIKRNNSTPSDTPM
jgi:hypothetical protein